MDLIKVVRNNIKTIILIFILFLGSNMPVLSSNDEDNPLEILFIGNSYSNFNNLPDLFSNLALLSEKNVHIGYYTPSGVSLYEHSKSENTEEKIRERRWDYIILIGGGGNIAYPNFYSDSPVHSALANLTIKINSNCLATRIIYCLPWAFEFGMTWLGWPDDYEDMQIIIYDKTIEYSNAFGFTAAPVGWAWYNILRKKNYPLHYLHSSDESHPSLEGSYLMACVIYSTIFIESTNEIPFYSDLTVSECDFFKTEASNTVLENTDLWNISPYTDTTEAGTTNNNLTTIKDIKNISTSEETAYIQNYPNPFSSVTSIKYNLNKDSEVKIEIFDLSGKKHATLVNKNQIAGIYTIKFDGKILKNGIYFYSLKTNENYIIKKMIISK
jgi:Secretion system C-terminal sorting domain